MDINACFLLTRFISPPISKDLIEIGMRIAMTSHQHLTLTKEAPHEAFD